MIIVVVIILLLIDIPGRIKQEKPDNKEKEKHIIPHQEVNKTSLYKVQIYIYLL